MKSLLYEIFLVCTCFNYFNYINFRVCIDIHKTRNTEHEHEDFVYQLVNSKYGNLNGNSAPIGEMGLLASMVATRVFQISNRLF